jgi:magnesium chelatase family protein
MEKVLFKDLQLTAALAGQVFTALSNGDLLLVGAVGSQKMTLARRLSSLIGGPFRAPHHTISRVGLAGSLKRETHERCEAGLANGGTLLLDEFPEFARSTIEALASVHCHNPREMTWRDGEDMGATPTSFKLIATAVPCPCGKTGAHPEAFPRGGECQCSIASVDRFLNRTERLGERFKFIPVEVVAKPIRNEDGGITSYVLGTPRDFGMPRIW